MRKNTLKSIITCFAVFIFLLSCSVGISAASNNSKAALKNRTIALMDARVNQDYKKVYSLFCSDFRNAIDLSRYSSSKKVNTIAYKIESIEIDPSQENATVTLKNTIKINGNEYEGVQNIQKWIFENDEWYLYVKPILNAMG